VLSTVVEKLPARSRKVLALDWDESALRVVEAVIGKNGVRLGRAISAPIPDDVSADEPDSFGAFVRRILAEKRIAVRHAVLAVPRDKAILISLRLPQSRVSELAGMVQLQASRELPFSSEEAVLDFAGSQARDAPEFLDVTVAAVRKETLEFYRSLAEAAGLHVLRLGLRPKANLLALTRGAASLNDDRILFVDIGPTATEIDILRWGRLAFSRAASVDTRLGSAAERSLLVEVQRTVEAYRATDPGATFDRIVVAGDSARAAPLVEALRSRFNAPTSLYDARWTVAVEPARAEQMVGFSAVLGLLIGQTVELLARFDFARPKRPIDTAALRRKRLIAAAVAGAVVLAAAWAGGAMYVSRLQDERTQLAKRISRLNDQVKRVKEIQKQIEAAQQWIGREVVWIDELRRIVEEMPANSEAYVTRLLVSAGQRHVRLDLHVNTADLPNRLATKLSEKFGYDVPVGNSRQTDRGKKYRYVAEMTIRIPEQKTAKPAPGRQDRLASRGAQDKAP